MNTEQKNIVELMEKVTSLLGYERGMICGRDCLCQWDLGYLKETIDAWKLDLENISSGNGRTSCQRHGAWVPAIPL